MNQEKSNLASSPASDARLAYEKKVAAPLRKRRLTCGSIGRAAFFGRRVLKHHPLPVALRKHDPFFFFFFLKKKKNPPPPPPPKKKKKKKKILRGFSSMLNSAERYNARRR